MVGGGEVSGGERAKLLRREKDGEQPRVVEKREETEETSQHSKMTRAHPAASSMQR